MALASLQGHQNEIYKLGKENPFYLGTFPFIWIFPYSLLFLPSFTPRHTDRQAGSQSVVQTDSCNNKRSNNWNASLQENWPGRPRVGLVTNSRQYRLQILCFSSVFCKHCVGCGEALLPNKRSANEVLLSAKNPSPDWNGKCCIPAKIFVLGVSSLCFLGATRIKFTLCMKHFSSGMSFRLKGSSQKQLHLFSWNLLLKLYTAIFFIILNFWS
jgi:hypothetical protein